jgi:redox-sensing transcriptional repressor
MVNCEKENISAVTNRNCIGRLSRYKSALYHFKDLGFTKIFSTYLAQAVGVTSTQIRKDFSIFKIYGNKRGGYLIDELISSLNTILSKNETHNVIMVGVGNLGRALIHYKGFAREGFKLIAAFDIDPAKHSTISEIPVLPLDRLSQFVKDSGVQFGILSVPAIVAQQVFEKMVDAGIKGVLNFAPCSLQTSDKSVFVNYVNLELELEQLVYFAKLKNKLTPFDSSAIDNFMIESSEACDACIAHSAIVQ